MDKKADIGLIGLAVMGQNLVLNMCDHGYTVAVFNRTTSKVDEFLGDAGKGFTNLLPSHSIEEFVGLLKRPRKVMLMVKAGEVVDQFIDLVVPHLEKGDIIIDGGNSHFPDSNRRTKALAEKGILFVGSGVSGGEEGARNGPSIMPGGNAEAWPSVKPIFQAIAAKTDKGEPCCDWVGGTGSGHYVKMVHNGIEYGDMQLISEAYHLMKSYAGMDHTEMTKALQDWNKGELNSYLIEIAAGVMAYKDADGGPLLEKILDTAGQKGTGKWTAVDALDMGIPVTLIGEAVFARCLSALKDERVKAAAVLGGGNRQKFTGDKAAFLKDLGEALLASKLVSYAQGYMLMREAAKEYGWDLNYGGIALMWRGGCIIRSVFLDKIKAAYDKNPKLDNLLMDDWFKNVMLRAQDSWRRVIGAGVMAGIPLPAMSTALAFFDGYRTAQLPANMLQGLRDYFGAHTYERTDKPRGQVFHTNWTGTGGNVSSSTYNV
ncbi:MAG: decarboxylating NADP(+)-dependent phosphogluconate dehydrogenase [Spirochaetales bacterium]